MNRSAKALYFVYLIGLVSIIAGITLLKGGAFIDRHEGDTLHLAEIVLRMAGGQWPHIDFVTPLGIAGFFPIVGFVWAGFGIGQAILLGQVAFATAIIPMLWWASVSRLPKWLCYVFGAITLIMILALVHGETGPQVSLSMHYNRWSWALAFIAIVIAALEPRGNGSQVADGLVLGLATAFLILCKITYGVAFAPALVVALLIRGQMRALITGLICVALCLLAVTIFAGLGFWQAYIGDLLLVSGSDIRPRAGLGWTDLVLAPAFFLGNTMLLAAVYLLRKGENPALGLILVLLAPGFIYVTFQNYGNDPKWLAVLAVLVLAGQPSRALGGVGLVVASLIAPSFLNMAFSPVRHLKLPSEGFVAIFEDAPHNDLETISGRTYTVHTQERMVFEGADFAYLNELAEHDEPPIWRGIEVATCLQQTGLIGTSQAMASDLDAVGYGKDVSVFVADTFSAGFWMFGETTPLKGGAPWYYGGLSGFDAADYLLVPSCPSSPRAFRAILRDLQSIEDELEERRRTELYTLYQIPKK